MAVNRDKEFQQMGINAQSNPNAYRSMQTNNVMRDYGNNTGAMYLAGTEQEKARQAANLSQVGAMTGQNLWQTGQQQQDYLASLQNRREGGDAVARRMVNSRNERVANVGRNMAGRKIAGGVGAAAMDSVQSKADMDIAAQQQGFDRQNDQDLWNYIKRNQKVTGEALAMGSDQGLADQISTDSGSGLSVICTELNRQGILDNETYKKDAEFGLYLYKHRPMALLGYRAWGTKVATAMSKSPFLTKAVSKIALPWAYYISGKENLLGKILFHVGLPICELIGQALVLHRVSKEA